MSKYRSGYEERIASAFVTRKIKFTYESTTLKYTSPPIPAKKRRYTPDFIFLTKKGHKIYVEAKGYLKPENRKIMKMVRKDNPDLDIRFLFMDGHKALTSKKKRQCGVNGLPFKSKTYGMWAEENGFKWASCDHPQTIGRILKEWYNE